MRSRLFTVASTDIRKPLDTGGSGTTTLNPVDYAVGLAPRKIGRAWRLAQNLDTILGSPNYDKLAGSFRSLLRLVLSHITEYRSRMAALQVGNATPIPPPYWNTLAPLSATPTSARNPANSSRPMP